MNRQSSSSNFVSARVMLDKQSPYLNSFIINIGSNKNIKNGMAVLDGKNFIGRIVDVNFFSSRVLLISDLNSKIPVILIEPSGISCYFKWPGKNQPLTLEYLPENHKIFKNGDIKFIHQAKKEFFLQEYQLAKLTIEEKVVKVILFSDLSQITFVNIDLETVLSKYNKLWLIFINKLNLNF